MIMAPKLPPSKIVDLKTVLAPNVMLSPSGAIQWATVEILYAAEQFQPTVLIRVPVPWTKDTSDEDLRALALRFARQLIDHACVMVPPAAETEGSPGVLEGTVLEGVSQELGITDPSTKPRRQRGR